MEFQSMKHLEIVPPERFPQGDSLILMIRLQRELNAKIYPIVMKNLRLQSLCEPESFTMFVKEEMTKEYLLAIIRECTEALDMINSKSWKQTKKDVNIRELKFEFIDIQFFTNCLYDIWMMNKNEVLGIFLAKYQENLERNKNGY